MKQPVVRFAKGIQAEFGSRIVADDRKVILAMVVNNESLVVNEQWEEEGNHIRHKQDKEGVVPAFQRLELANALSKNRNRSPLYFLCHLNRILGSTITYTMSEIMFPTSIKRLDITRIPIATG